MPGAVTPELLRNVAQFSRFEDGPRRAVDLLGALGIAVEMVPHLPKTHLDGAALRMADGPPVIGLTLRYDRIDNFWFCLLHELAHVGRHLDAGEDASFVHDHSLRGSRGAQRRFQGDRGGRTRGGGAGTQGGLGRERGRAAPRPAWPLWLSHPTWTFTRRSSPVRVRYKLGELPAAVPVRRLRPHPAAVRIGVGKHVPPPKLMSCQIVDSV